MRNAIFATVGLAQAHPNHCKTLSCNTNLGLIECSAILGKASRLAQQEIKYG